MSTATTPNQASLTPSETLRAKFQPSDIQLATERAEQFLASRGAKDRFTSEVTTLLVDYDLQMLDEMFESANASSHFVSEP